jgi:hypothetical protein
VQLRPSSLHCDPRLSMSIWQLGADPSRLDRDLAVMLHASRVCSCR